VIEIKDGQLLLVVLRTVIDFGRMIGPLRLGAARRNLKIFPKLDFKDTRMPYGIRVSVSNHAAKANL
jgi:hypothetical protein